MKLYEIQIPVSPNDAWDENGNLIKGVKFLGDKWKFTRVHHAEFLSHLTHLAKGYSRLPEIDGVWVNGEGTEFREKMIPIRVATDKFYIDLFAKLAKTHYKQEAIFVAELGEARFF